MCLRSKFFSFFLSACDVINRLYNSLGERLNSFVVYDWEKYKAYV
jgi:hypothetical protein